MKTLAKALVLAAIVATVVTITAMPALAQSPTPAPAQATTPVAPAATVAPTAAAPSPIMGTGVITDPIVGLPCDWVGMDPAPKVGYPVHRYYKLPYTFGTLVTLYASTTNKKEFGFDVYTQYRSTLYYSEYANNPIGKGTYQSQYALGDLMWAGRLEAGKDNGWFLIDVFNKSTDPVWYSFCSMVR